MLCGSFTAQKESPDPRLVLLFLPDTLVSLEHMGLASTCDGIQAKMSVKSAKTPSEYLLDCPKGVPGNWCDGLGPELWRSLANK